ncbi:MAG: STAS domain-containing protein [Chloroflexota bacterium]
MPAKQLEASVRRLPGVAIIDLRGEINATAEAALNAAYAKAEQGDPRAVLLNFVEVDYINSTGIALIVGLLARARSSNRQLRAYGLSDHYVEIFHITRLADFMQVFSDEAAAVAVGES